MSFVHSFLANGAKTLGPIGKIDPATKALVKSTAPSTPPPTPGVPNPNDAANAAQNLTDSMRMRRGLMANIYAGAGQQAPVTGKTQLGQ